MRKCTLRAEGGGESNEGKLVGVVFSCDLSWAAMGGGLFFLRSRD